MTTRLSHRIGSLERLHATARGPRICPECGDGSSEREFIVERQGENVDEPDHCTTCGRQTTYRIEFDQRG